MKEVHIKFLFLPGGCCAGNRLRVRSKGKTLARLSGNETCILKLPAGQKLTFTYNFHYRTTITLPDNGDKTFIVVYYFVREYFPAILLDAFRKLVVVNIVDEEEYNRADKENYKEKLSPKQDFEQDISVLVIGFLLSLIYIFLPFVYFKNNENNQDLSFFIGVMGVIGFAMLIGQKKLIQLKEYKARVLVFSALSIMLDIILPLSAFMKYTLLLATGMLILRAWMMKPKTSKSSFQSK